MTEGPGIATMAYLGEQVPDFGMPSAQRRSNRAPKYAGVEALTPLCCVLQFDPTDPAFNPSATKAEFVGDLLDGIAPFKKRPNLTE